MANKFCLDEGAAGGKPSESSPCRYHNAPGGLEDRAARTWGSAHQSIHGRSTDGAWTRHTHQKRRPPVGKDFLENDQPRQGKRDNGYPRGAEGLQEEAGEGPAGWRLARISEAEAPVDAGGEEMVSEQPGRCAGVEEIDPDGEEKQQDRQVKAADTTQQAFATAYGPVLGQQPQTISISHLPPHYRAMSAAMERQPKRINPVLHSLLLGLQHLPPIEH